MKRYPFLVLFAALIAARQNRRVIELRVRAVQALDDDAVAAKLVARGVLLRRHTEDRALS